MKRVSIVNERIQLFDGYRYSCGYKGRYYRRQLKLKGKSTSLSIHRAVWEYHHGFIEEGMHVHHIDGDWHNNQLKNLTLLTGHFHLSQHNKTPERLEQLRISIEHARKSAIKWHKDPANREFHVRIAKKSWENKQVSEVTCAHCEKPFNTPFPTRTRFCSNNCKMKGRTRRLKGLPENAKRGMI